MFYGEGKLGWEVSVRRSNDSEILSLKSQRKKSTKYVMLTVDKYF